MHQDAPSFLSSSMLVYTHTHIYVLISSEFLNTQKYHIQVCIFCCPSNVNNVPYHLKQYLHLGQRMNI